MPSERSYAGGPSIAALPGLPAEDDIPPGGRGRFDIPWGGVPPQRSAGQGAERLEASTMTGETLLRTFFTPKRVSPQDVDRRALAGATWSCIDVGGQRLPTWSWGVGPRVMLVHGWDSRGSRLAFFVPILLSRGFSVTVFDAPAHGDAPGEISSPIHMGRALLAVAGHFGDVQGVIGHSAGSAASLWAFGQGLKVQSSVHLAGPSTFEHVMLDASRRAALSAEEYQAFRSSASTFMGCAIEDLVVDRLVRSLAHQGLIVHDPDDPIISFSESQDLHDRWPRSTLLAVRGVGHGRFHSERWIVDACVQFLVSCR